MVMLSLSTGAAAKCAACLRVELDWEVLLLGTEATHATRAGLTVPVHVKIDDAAEMDAVIVHLDLLLVRS